jgi:dTDP-4-amino-4,6-dideoxygalactose transaminase
MNHGRDSIYISCTDDQGAEGNKLQEIIEKRFSFTHIGHSFRCTEMEAAIGLGQLNRAAEIVARRKQIAEHFSRELSQYSDLVQLPSCPSDRTHSYMLYGLVLRNESKRRLVNYLENLNIETRDLLPLINQPIYRRLFGNLENVFPVAKWINDSGFYIGCHSYMSNDEISFVVDSFHNFFRQN